MHKQQHERNLEAEQSKATLEGQMYCTEAGLKQSQSEICALGLTASFHHLSQMNSSSLSGIVSVFNTSAFWNTAVPLRFFLGSVMHWLGCTLKN